MIARFAVALGALLLAHGNAGAMDLKEFKKKFGQTPNSWERRNLVKQLDPNDKKSRKILFAVLKGPMFDWYMRQAVIDVFTGVTEPKTIKALEKVKPNRDPLSAEGVAMAFGRSKSAERIPYLEDCMKSKKWVVRRAASIALRHIRDKQAITLLIDTWRHES